jgi:hypothetical protein
MISSEENRLGGEAITMTKPVSCEICFKIIFCN